MKLNMKYCLIGLFLISIIIFSCLGNNLYEGLINENEVRENTYKSGAEYAKKEGEQYNNLIKSQGIGTENNNMIQPVETDFNSCNEKCLKDCEAGSAHHPPGFDCNEYCSKVCNKKFPNSNNNLGGDVDKYGCKPSAGEKWCESSKKCIKNWDEDCSDNEDRHKRRRDKKEHNCGRGTVWDEDKGKCVAKHKSKELCGDGTKWDDYKKMCVQSLSGENLCGEGTFFDKLKKMCIPNQNNNDSNGNNNNGSNQNSNNLMSSNDSNISNNQNQLDNNFNYQNNYSSTSSSELLGNDSGSNNSNDYILRTKVVPPVCPACPPVQACPSNKKCPPCPAPEPIQPCPPCARCPEPAFECKKVPNYNSTNTDFLPRPLLNDFSKFS